MSDIAGKLVIVVASVACTGVLTACAPAGQGNNPGAAVGPPSTAAASRTTAASPATGTTPAADPILQGRRQVVIVPVPSFESVLAVGDGGRLGTTDGDSDRSLFVLTPVKGAHLIRTAKADRGGEPSCMRVKNNGSRSLTVVAAACDAGDGAQLFTVAVKGRDKEGRPAYAISNGAAYLQIFRGQLIAEELGDAPLATTYSFVDNGAASPGAGG